MQIHRARVTARLMSMLPFAFCLFFDTVVFNFQVLIMLPCHLGSEHDVMWQQFWISFKCLEWMALVQMIQITVVWRLSRRRFCSLWQIKGVEGCVDQVRTCISCC